LCVFTLWLDWLKEREVFIGLMKQHALHILLLCKQSLIHPNHRHPFHDHTPTPPQVLLIPHNSFHSTHKLNCSITEDPVYAEDWTSCLCLRCTFSHHVLECDEKTLVFAIRVDENPVDVFIQPMKWSITRFYFILYLSFHCITK
jgi:hypothetical protein